MMCQYSKEPLLVAFLNEIVVLHSTILLNSSKYYVFLPGQICFDFYYIELPRRLELPQIKVFSIFFSNKKPDRRIFASFTAVACPGMVYCRTTVEVQYSIFKFQINWKLAHF